MWNSPRCWNNSLPWFESKGYTVHAPTLPYHDVAPDDPVPDDLAKLRLQDYCEALIAEAKKLDAPPVIIGHSMGGLLAQLVAVGTLHQGLVLLSPAQAGNLHLLPSVSAVKTLWPIIRRWGFWSRATRLPREQALWGIFNDMPEDVAQEEIDRLISDSGRALYQIALPWLDPSHGSWVDYSRLSHSALVVVGTNDRITPIEVARATTRKLPKDSSYREIDGAGHWLFHEPVVSTLNQIIENYLDSRH